MSASEAVSLGQQPMNLAQSSTVVFIPDRFFPDHLRRDGFLPFRLAIMISRNSSSPLATQDRSRCRPLDSMLRAQHPRSGLVQSLNNAKTLTHRPDRYLNLDLS